MNKLEKQFPQLQKDHPLASYSTFQIGGPADYFLIVKNKDDLKKAYSLAKEEGINTFILGGGSNLIFSDKGFRGLVIKNEACSFTINGTQIIAESGVLWSQIIHKAIEHNLAGIEKFMGLPGTLGAAVRGNAGCHGVETKDVLVKATILDAKTGEEKEVNADYFEFDYRESKLKKAPELVLEVTFQLQENPGQPEDLRNTMKDLLIDRRQKQPTGKNSGSFFKNPSKEHSAGKLIDQAGLKGLRVGDCEVSEVHANFFMNKGNATQSDLVNLAREVVENVYNKTKIRLEQEVYIIDEYGKSIQVT